MAWRGRSASRSQVELDKRLIRRSIGTHQVQTKIVLPFQSVESVLETPEGFLQLTDKPRLHTTPTRQLSSECQPNPRHDPPATLCSPTQHQPLDAPYLFTYRLPLFQVGDPDHSFRFRSSSSVISCGGSSFLAQIIIQRAETDGCIANS